MLQEKEEFSDSIIRDTAVLGVTYEKLTHTSDYFPEMLDLAERLIKKGSIYADDTPLEQMRAVKTSSVMGVFGGGGGGCFGWGVAGGG